jgi:Dihaem cytochrome c
MSRNASNQTGRVDRRWTMTFALLGLITTSGAAILSGCQSDNKSGNTAAAGAPTTRPDDPLASVFGPAPAKSGTQLWSENCTRCHNARPPTTYSGAQWTLVMHHMRSRANLTGEEERKILAFLQAGATSD